MDGAEAHGLETVAAHYDPNTWGSTNMANLLLTNNNADKIYII